jgi:hypothetical protein
MDEWLLDILTGPRNESWRVDVLNLNDAAAGSLDGITGGQFDYSIHNTIRSGGSLTYSGSQAINWPQIRLQPWYMLKDEADNVVKEWPLGVFIPSTPQTKYSETGAEIEVELYDKLLILDQDRVENTWSYDKGKKVTDAIREVIESAGDFHISITESPLTLAAPMVWEVDTTKLKIVNELLEAINYFSLWVDGYGFFRADPYKQPRSRGIAWEFVDNERSIYSPEFTHDEDGFNVPNKVIAIQKVEAEVEPLIAVATNEDPESPWSYQSRKRWISHTENDVEAADAATLGDIAARRLIDLSQVTSTFEIQSAMIPLELNSRVILKNEVAKKDLNAVLQGLSIGMATGELMTLTLREVV